MKNYATALGMVFTFELPHAAHAQSVVTPPAVPDNIQVPPPNHAGLREYSSMP